MMPTYEFMLMFSVIIWSDDAICVTIWQDNNIDIIIWLDDIMSFRIIILFLLENFNSHSDTFYFMGSDTVSVMVQPLFMLHRKELVRCSPHNSSCYHWAL
jgi:hypothetical protein